MNGEEHFLGMQVHKFATCGGKSADSTMTQNMMHVDANLDPLLAIRAGTRRDGKTTGTSFPFFRCLFPTCQPPEWAS